MAYNLGRYDEAAAAYENSYRAVQDPTLLFNIGQSYRLAGKRDRALAAYKGFLRTAPNPHPNRELVSTRVAEIERQIEAERTSAAAAASSGVTPAPPAPAPVQPAAPPAPAPPAQPAAQPPGPYPQAAPYAPQPTPYPQAEPYPAQPQPARYPGTPTPPPPVTAPSDRAAQEPSLRATLGGYLGGAGKANTDGHGAGIYRAYGRIADTGRRVYELGYLSDPIYPMNPRFQFSALYGVIQSAGAWSLSLGALGRNENWLLGIGWRSEILTAGLRLEGLEAKALCSRADGRLTYVIPEVGLRIQATNTFVVKGLASYRGRLATGECQFRPSMLTLGAVGELSVREAWRFSGGLGRYSLHDYGTGGAPSGWLRDEQNSSLYLHLGAGYVLGRLTLRLDFRQMSWGGSVSEFLLGLELRSRKDAP